LSVVPADAPPPPKKPMTLAEAIEAGTYLDILLAQRRDLAKDIRDAQGPAKAAMHRQFLLLSKEIAALEAAAREEALQDADADEADEPFDAADL
jgi:hypothetical protein